MPPSSSHRIERATADDAEAMSQLWVESIKLLVQVEPIQFEAPRDWHGFAQYLQTRLGDGTVIGFVARAAAQVVGFVHGRLSERPPPHWLLRVACIDELYVDPRWRRAGVGSSLVAAFEEWACSSAAWSGSN